MSEDKTKIKGGQSLNEEFGGKYKNIVGEKVEIDENGSSVSEHAEIESNDASIRVGAGFETDVYKYKNDDVEVKVGETEGDAHAELGLGGVGAEADLGVHAVNVESHGVGLDVGAGVDTGATIGPGGVSLEVAGTGVKIGKKTSVSLLGTTLSVDFSKLKFW